MKEKHENRHPVDLLPGEEALAGFYGRGHGEQPPAHLDEAILAAARREVRAGPRGRQRRKREWLLPTSLAASILLVTGVLLYLEFQPVETAEIVVAGAPRPAPGDAGGGAQEVQQVRATPSIVALRDAPAEEEPAGLTLPAKSRMAAPELARRAPEDTDPARRTTTPPAYTGSPQAWLEEIRRLVDAGRLHDARRELDTLIAQYPDFRSTELSKIQERLVNVAPAR